MKLKLFKSIFRRKARDAQSVHDFESIDDLKKTLETGKASSAIVSSCDSTVATSKIADDDVSEAHNENEVAHGGKEGNSDVIVVDWKLPTFDEATTNIQTMEKEMERLLILRSFYLLDTGREDHFNRIVQLAAEIFHTPLALISLVDLGRQWFLSSHGLDESITETQRNLSVCAHVVQGKSDKPLVIPDLSKDFRFKDNPLVTGPFALRFYAGAPLISPEGVKLGSFCVIDVVPRPEGLNFFEEEILTDLASMTMKIMVERRERLHNLQSNTKTSANDESAMMESFDRLICPITDMQKLFSNINKYIEPLPKAVPITVEFDAAINDAATHIEADDLLLFRSSLILLNHAVSHTKAGSIIFHVSLVKNNVLFECHDTGMPLISETKNEFGEVGSQFGIVESMVKKMNGKYGIKNDGVEKTCVWFSIPFVSVDMYMGESSASLNQQAPTIEQKASLRTHYNANLPMLDEGSSKDHLTNKLKFGSIMQDDPFHKSMVKDQMGCTPIASISKDIMLPVTTTSFESNKSAPVPMTKNSIEFDELNEVMLDKMKM